MKCLPCVSLVLLLFGGCSSQATQPSKQPATPSQSDIETLMLQPATVTEVFHLRGECVDLGKKTEERRQEESEERLRNQNNTMNEYLTYSVRTNYSISANRCYVLLTADGQKSQAQTLYDGQTEELLAATLIFKDGRPSRAFMGSIQDGIPKETDYSKATDFIDRMMDDGEPKQ